MNGLAGVIGIDLGGTNLKLALLDDENRIMERAIVATDGDQGQEAVIARIAGGIESLRTASPGLEVAGVGIGVPGEVDMATGVTIELPNLPGRWLGVPVGQSIAAASGLPVGVINDAKAFAVAEHRIGAAFGAETALLVTIGTGIGGAVIAHGEIVYGIGGAAGEIGHLIMQPRGPRCTCGNRGCLETLASGPAIVAEAVRRVVQGFSTSVKRLSSDDLNGITPELVARAAEAGDPVAVDIIDRAGEWLGLALAGAIALLAPEVVVLGGGVAAAGSRYVRAAEAAARTHTGVLDIDRVIFRTARLGYDAGVIGAALWGRDHALKVTRNG
ncbi:MAG: ROK family protein [Chloroflexia bacterium]|nr:ROK family protein [Chloroflexia bacterium]